MMNLREIAAKKLTEQLLSDCEEEYHAMWHNGSIRGNWPDIERNEEWESFWSQLAFEVEAMVSNLQDEIKETWGLTFNIFSWGRSGATIAPDNFSFYGNGRHFNRTLDLGKIVDFSYYEEHEEEQSPAGDWWTEAYKTAKDHLAAFNLINDRVAAGAGTDLAEWWEETKAACELTFGEDEDEELEDLKEEAAG